MSAVRSRVLVLTDPPDSWQIVGLFSRLGAIDVAEFVGEDGQRTIEAAAFEVRWAREKHVCCVCCSTNTTNMCTAPAQQDGTLATHRSHSDPAHSTATPLIRVLLSQHTPAPQTHRTTRITGQHFSASSRPLDTCVSTIDHDDASSSIDLFMTMGFILAHRLRLLSGITARLRAARTTRPSPPASETGSRV